MNIVNVHEYAWISMDMRDECPWMFADCADIHDANCRYALNFY